MNWKHDIAIANWFIERALAQGTRLTQMQLHKLVYFAHALKLAAKNEPLTFGKFQAWDYGPVLPDLYEHTKHWGKTPISEPIAIPIAAYNLQIPRVEADIDYLESTWRNYSHFSATRLSEISHERNGPWDRCYEPWQNNTIPNQAIADFYRARVTS